MCGNISPEDLPQADAIDFTESDHSEGNKPKLGRFLVSGLRSCPPACWFILTPSFLRLSAWADKSLECVFAVLPAALPADPSLAIWCTRARTVVSSVSYLFFFAGLPAAFSFHFWAFLSWHRLSLRALPSLSKAGSLQPLLSSLLPSSKGLAPRQCLHLAEVLLVAALFCPLLCLPFWATLGHPENLPLVFAFFPFCPLVGLVFSWLGNFAAARGLCGLSFRASAGLPAETARLSFAAAAGGWLVWLSVSWLPFVVIGVDRTATVCSFSLRGSFLNSGLAALAPLLLFSSKSCSLIFFPLSFGGMLAFALAAVLPTNSSAFSAPDAVSTLSGICDCDSSGAAPLLSSSRFFSSLDPSGFFVSPSISAAAAKSSSFTLYPSFACSCTAASMVLSILGGRSSSAFSALSRWLNIALNTPMRTPSTSTPWALWRQKMQEETAPNLRIWSSRVAAQSNMCFQAFVLKIVRLQLFLTDIVAKPFFFQNPIGERCLWSLNTKNQEMQPLKVGKMWQGRGSRSWACHCLSLQEKFCSKLNEMSDLEKKVQNRTAPEPRPNRARTTEVQKIRENGKKQEKQQNPNHARTTPEPWGQTGGTKGL